MDKESTSYKVIWNKNTDVFENKVFISLFYLKKE